MKLQIPFYFTCNNSKIETNPTHEIFVEHLSQNKRKTDVGHCKGLKKLDFCRSLGPKERLVIEPSPRSA